MMNIPLSNHAKNRLTPVLDSVARIMAAESIIIIEKHGIPTASFDLANRIVYIPVWDAYILTYENHVALRSHEVGHAVWTPNGPDLFDALRKEGILGYVNVLEDIRINEFLKRKYPGLIRIFNQSYRRFFDTNFYGVNHGSVNGLDFADRINIALKVGTYAGVKFDETEKRFLAKLENLYSFNQVIILARELAGIVKKQKDEQDLTIAEDSVSFSLKTEESFESSLQQHITKYRPVSRVLTLPAEHNLEKFVNQYSVFLDNIKNLSEIPSSRDRYDMYKKDNRDLISYMVKEFEMKKSAQEYQKAKISETGIIDPLKIHKYAYDENIFLRSTTLPNGKNHGLVLFVDWSGSMNRMLQNTIFQLFNIVLFCKKLSIPFTVYLFRNKDLGKVFSRVSSENKVIVNNVELDEILNHEMPVKEFNMAMTALSNVKRLITSNFKKYTLTGTPLNECIILSRDLVSGFIKKNRLEKATIIFLTDGESSWQTTGNQENNIILSLHSKYQKDTGQDGLTAALLNVLKFETKLNICGIYIPNSESCVIYKINQLNLVSGPLMEKYRSAGFVALEGLGYDKLFVIDNSLVRRKKFKTESDETFDFSKSRKARMQSLVFLKSFIEMIA